MSSDGELVLGWLRTSIAPTGDDGSARALVAWLCDGGADCTLLRSMHAMITQELRTRRAHSTTIRIGAALATAMIEHIVAYDLAVELVGLLLASKCAGSALGHIRAACAAVEASNHPPVHVAMIRACARALETNAVDTDTRVVAYALDRMLRMAVADTRARRRASFADCSPWWSATRCRRTTRRARGCACCSRPGWRPRRSRRTRGTRAWRCRSRTRRRRRRSARTRRERRCGRNARMGAPVRPNDVVRAVQAAAVDAAARASAAAYFALRPARLRNAGIPACARALAVLARQPGDAWCAETACAAVACVFAAWRDTDWHYLAPLAADAARAATNGLARGCAQAVRAACRLAARAPDAMAWELAHALGAAGHVAEMHALDAPALRAYFARPGARAGACAVLRALDDDGGAGNSAPPPGKRVHGM